MYDIFYCTRGSKATANLPVEFLVNRLVGSSYKKSRLSCVALLDSRLLFLSFELMKDAKEDHTMLIIDP